MPKKGQKMSEETKRKISLARMGLKFSEETKRKMSLAKKGKPSYWKGKKKGPLSSGTRRKISLANKGRKRTEEFRRKMSREKVGSTVPEETREKIRNSLKGRKHSEETKRKIGLAHRGMKRSPETCRKISESNKGKKISKESRRKLSESLKGKKRNPCPEETRRKISKANKGKMVSLETRRKLSELQRGKKLTTEQRLQLRRSAKNLGSLEDLKKEAIEKGGECLSTEYINSKHKYKYRCGDGHIFYKRPKYGWCPCCPNKSEQECREIFEAIFGEEFPQTRPDWLRNPKTGRRLELDGYNEELKVAFEYNGKQHYKKVNYLYPYSLVDQQLNDRRKKDLCKKMDILLIVIPYWIEDKYKFIIKSLRG